MVEKPDAADLDRVTGDLKFCDVSFGYNDDMALVLNALNLHIKSGEIVAIVGPSGGGKTTLVKLLLPLYDPISGESFKINLSMVIVICQMHLLYQWQWVLFYTHFCQSFYACRLYTD